MDTPGEAPGTPETPAPGPTRRWAYTTVFAVIVAALAGVALGAAIDGAQDAPAASDTSDTSVTSDTSAVDGGDPLDAPAVSTPELVSQRYLAALQTGDWRAAHDLMCVDLAEQISPAALKREVASSIEQAGGVIDFVIGESTLDEASRTATVEYVLRFDDGTVENSIELAREGSAWRLCEFVSIDRTGVFED